MRSFLAALLASAALACCARAGDLRYFDDAALHAVQFVDKNEGWTVGDEGVVWHTIDGGTTWERQPTGVRASLRSVHFLNPYTGWIAGREEQPHGAGSTGVLLYTKDGGLKWQRVTLNSLPGLNRIRFIDNKTGFVAGDGTEQYPTGLFTTIDSGRSWQPVPGPRCPAWLAADFQDSGDGALAGAWNRLAKVRQGKVVMADVDTLGGRNLRDLQLVGKRGVAVGQGGLVLFSDTSAGATWELADLQLPTEVKAGLDFHGVHWGGSDIWVVGRPGSVVLHSKDQGNNWEMVRTGQPLPLEAVFFIDETHGWAVGELGTILGTADGGRTWTAQHRGGERIAVLLAHARSGGLPADTVALLGGEEGYLVAAVRVAASDPGSAALARASEGQRLAAAMRMAGGAAGELLWQFPVSQHLAHAEQADVVKSWDGLHGGRSTDQLLRQLVLALRIWRPSVVITDLPDAKMNGYPADALTAEAMRLAFLKAGDPRAFPEQIERLGLEPWQALKLYACWDQRASAQVSLDLNEPQPRLEATARDFAGAAAGLLVDTPMIPPSQRYYRLLESQLKDSTEHHDLMEGITLAPGGVARRKLTDPAPPSPELVKAIRTCQNLQALAQTPANGLTNPDKLLAQIGPALAGLPDHQAAPAAFAVASQYARMGQWTLAREAFLLMVDRYPAHPLSADAYRWLIRYNSSSEARRRQELGQFLVVSKFETHPTDNRTQIEQPESISPDRKGARVIPSGIESRQQRQLALLGSSMETRQWYQGCLEIEPRLAAFGRIHATDPAMQFCWQAAHRNLGDFETAQKWYAAFAREHPPGPWRDAALAELWLSNRSGSAPKPVAFCRQSDTRPFLDGKLDDACWLGAKPIVLQNAVGDTVKEYATEARLAYDKDFLYVAFKCRHPADRYVAPVKVRPRDADVRPYDRVSLMLDLDRDYSTYFHLQFDQRGCVCEDCWGDLSWNPRCFVAVDSDAEGYRIEAAIPMIELTGDLVTPGRTWACNAVRILPGRGVQALSTPADVQPRPEGMGLLLFIQDARPAPASGTVKVPMTKVP